MISLLIYSIVLHIVNQMTPKVSFELVNSVTSWVRCCNTLWWKIIG